MIVLIIIKEFVLIFTFLPIQISHIAMKIFFTKKTLFLTINAKERFHNENALLHAYLTRVSALAAFFALRGIFF